LNIIIGVRNYALGYNNRNPEVIRVFSISTLGFSGKGLVIMQAIYAIFLVLLMFVLAAVGIYLLLEGSILPKKSTREFFKLSKMPLIKLIEGYFYASRPDLYLKPITWSWFKRLFTKSETGDNYHGKVIPLENARKIIKLDKPVEMADLEHIIPYPVARSIVLSNPMPSIAVMECPCRAQKENSCPRDVCLVVGEPFVSFVVEHSPNKARKIKVEEALQILEEEEKRGHIHTAWFKEAMHNRFYTICNCCSCCCLGMASYFRGVSRIAHSGYQPIINKTICKSCGNCISTCLFGAIKLDDIPAISAELCMGCGVCVSHCPLHAIDLTPAPEKGIPLDVEALS
jgi:Pyruvate/2-oxoacid:ferredoxin oxidoreductase delta subunit